MHDHLERALSTALYVHRAVEKKEGPGFAQLFRATMRLELAREAWEEAKTSLDCRTMRHAEKLDYAALEHLRAAQAELNCCLLWARQRATRLTSGIALAQSRIASGVQASASA